MEYNPYSAPRAPAGAEPDAPPPMGAPQPWELGDVMGRGWRAVKEHWPVLVFAPFVALLIQSFPSGIPGVALFSGSVEPNSAEYWTIYGICTFVGMLIQTFFLAGQIKIFCSAARGQAPNFGDLFAGGAHFLPLLLAVFITALATSIATLLFVVPGVIVGLGLSMAQFFVVDANMGAIDALKKSWEVTTGHKANLFLFWIVGFVVMLLGCVACYVGLFVAMPTVMVASATIYLRLSGQDPMMAPKMGFGPSPGMPPIGFGGPPMGR